MIDQSVIVWEQMTYCSWAVQVVRFVLCVCDVGTGLLRYQWGTFDSNVATPVKMGYESSLEKAQAAAIGAMQ